MKAVTLRTLNNFKSADEKFPVITAYDSAFARQVELAGIEVALVGDSLGNVILGYDSTVPVTMDDMLHHTAAVARGNSKSLLIADMPFMSYATEEMTLDNAALLMQAGAQMVKLEGGYWLEESVLMLSQRGIPVCGHLGLTPQSFNKLGGYQVQGRDEDAAQQIFGDAEILQEAGADLLVLECVPTDLATRISQHLTIPVIGIGAGPGTDAQVLVLYDMLGFSPRIPRFTKNFLASTGDVQLALKAYADAVRNGHFPEPEHCFK
ncbi:MAG: 3-methyl-2-oxobutanoate hydroxymethyltransferase [Gammaproteobacteria bacterium]|nr:MAG: 3-methyl-2-oxobutanoate hydroxymethyltransferase [Gammaproteobacteria bacterium]